MARKVIWSSNALDDRLNILEYWSTRLGNKLYSQKLDKEFIALCRFLSQFPFMGRRFRDENERCFVKGNYLIVYQVSDNGIEILHVWDTRRNPEELIL
ncbi:MAG: type II toxin-antitoxin system RelE/ParE family toxin [Ignavibacteriae bacterium]|nr:type II toxin-antitoxin system RelE/ParE family toxin [Ignavibacteriota bacterium]